MSVKARELELAKFNVSRLALGTPKAIRDKKKATRPGGDEKTRLVDNVAMSSTSRTRCVGKGKLTITKQTK